MDTELRQRQCPECGMDARDWTGNNGQGYTLDDETYCCEGCAEGPGCTCEPAVKPRE